jgi:hypothetical protein
VRQPHRHVLLVVEQHDDSRKSMAELQNAAREGRRQLITSEDAKPNWESVMIRKLASGKYRLYSRKQDPKTGKRSNLGTFETRAAAEKHERAVQYFKRHSERLGSAAGL